MAVMYTEHPGKTGVYRKRIFRRRRFPLLTLLALGVFFLIMGFGSATGSIGNVQFWTDLFPFKTKIEPMRFGGVALGTGLLKVKRMYPDLKLDTNGRHGVSGTYTSGKKRYKIWFLDKDNGYKAYKIRYTRKFTGIDETEVHKKLSGKFGMPSTTTCQRSTFSAENNCRFQWWPPAGISVTALSKVKRSSYHGRYVLLILTASDPYLEGKRRRLLARR